MTNTFIKIIVWESNKKKPSCKTGDRHLSGKGWRKNRRTNRLSDQ